MSDLKSAASPQAENGHIDIAHEIAEAFYKLQLSGNQWRLLWVILRQSYGWKKKLDKISFSFFEDKTGIDRRNIGRELKELISRHIIVKNDNSYIISYGLQKDYKKWIYKPLSKMTIVNNDNKVLSKLTTTKETIQKKITTEEIISKIQSLEARYFDSELINQCFKAISSTRKTNRISDNVKLNILNQWDKYPADQVTAGIHIYLEKNYASQGKSEKYLLGIIRGNLRQQPAENTPTGKMKKTTGSVALDNAFRQQGFQII